MTASAERVDPREVRRQLESGGEMLLVCAYDSAAQFEQNHLEGAIALNDLRARQSAIAPDRVLVFYCACPHDEIAAHRACEYRAQGFHNVKVLDGGVRAWRDACRGPVA
jgi:rhodanese-related sulfurtransferase